MWNPFRKKAPPVQRTPLEEAQIICDLANATIPHLPRNVSFWMDWTQRPPRLVLNERQPGRTVYPQRGTQ